MGGIIPHIHHTRRYTSATAPSPKLVKPTETKTNKVALDKLRQYLNEWRATITYKLIDHPIKEWIHKDK